MSLARQGNKSSKIINSPAFAYFVPEINQVIKVEKAFYKTYVAHYPNGLERINFSEMKENGWECKGRWEGENGN